MPPLQNLPWTVYQPDRKLYFLNRLPCWPRMRFFQAVLSVSQNGACNAHPCASRAGAHSTNTGLEQFHAGVRGLAFFRSFLRSSEISAAKLRNSAQHIASTESPKLPSVGNAVQNSESMRYSLGLNYKSAPPARARTSRACPQPLGCQLGVGVGNEVKRPAWLGTQHNVSAVLHDENRGCALEDPCDTKNGSACNKQVIVTKLQTFSFCGAMCVPRPLIYTKNSGSIITYCPGFCGEILIRVGPLVIVAGILICVMEATYPLGCALPVPVLPH